MNLRRRPVAVMALCASSLALGACAATPDVDVSVSSAGTAPAGSPQCSYPVSGSPAKPVDPPSTAGVARTGTSTATLVLDGKPVVITMDRSATPCTAHNFESLATQGWFDGTKCHRLTTQGIFVLQCGDPTGSGMGGPGYTFADELTGTETYPKGAVAMANAGPNTNGSQFFLVWRDTPLPPNYTVFGTLDAASLAVVEKIAAQGTGAKGESPKAPALIDTVTLG